MKKVSPKRFSEFVEIALRAGATAARIIPSEWVVIDERVRFKCEVPIRGRPEGRSCGARMGYKGEGPSSPDLPE